MASGTEVAKAYVQIIPSARGISGKIKEQLGGEADSAGKSAGNSIVDGIKNVIGAAAIGAAIKKSLDAGGAVQQSFGGLETLYNDEKFGDASEKMKEYAQQAVAVGISANSYAEQATSFGAALKSAFGGDVVKAAESANQAIIDMADNSSKFGTDIESIQNAYQGFAKGNYTMLDNLKLGYGGTKSEMERLLKDAEKLTGVKYDINNLGDVYSAIHAVQEDLNITGNAAKEAGQTFTGSFESMKAAAENMLAALSVGELDIGPQMEALVSSAANFLFNNLIPMLASIATNIPEAIGTAIETAGPILEEQVSGMLDSVFAFLEGGGQTEMTVQGLNLITGLYNGVMQAIPVVLNIGMRIISDLIQGISQNLPLVIEQGTELVNSFINNVIAMAPAVIDGGLALISQLVSGIVTNLPLLLSSAADIVSNIASGITENLPSIALQAASVISTMTENITSNLPSILASGVDLVISIITGIVQALPAILEAAVVLVSGFLQGIVAGLPNVLEAGKTLIVNLIEGVFGFFGNLYEAGKEAVSNFINGFMSDGEGAEQSAGIIVDSMTGEIIYTDWAGTGAQIPQEISEGVYNNMDDITAAAQEIAADGQSIIDGYNWMGTGSGVTSEIAAGMVDDSGSFTTATNAIGTEIATGLNAQTGTVSDAAASVSEAASVSVTADVDWTVPGTTATDTLTSGIESGSSQVESSAKSVADSAITQFKGAQWAAAGQEAITKISSGIKSTQSNVSTALRAAAVAGQTAFRSVGWDSVGSGIIAGIKSGVSSSSGSLYSQLRSVASSALSAAKSELAINSPSKKFRDIVGKGMMEGWTDGVTNNENMLLSAVSDVADDSIGAARFGEFATGNERTGGTSGRIIQLLEIIADKDTTLKIGNREFRRSLEDNGVQFA